MLLGVVSAVMVVAGILLAGASLVVLRSVEARPGTARRLAGPPEVRVGRLLDGELPERPVRVSGRIRCTDPLEAPDGERLVAFHRDVEVRAAGAWRTIERIRETRSFQLWDHDGSLAVDPARAAEPLITIPKVWRGSPDRLQGAHASGLAALVARHGRATEARAVTRTINVTDRLLIVARPARAADGTTRLDPPGEGFLVTNLALDDAMRLLAGQHRRAAAGAVVGLGLGVSLCAVGAIGGLFLLLGAVLA